MSCSYPRYRTVLPQADNGWSSATYNHVSHDRWGRKYISRLKRLHRTHPPTHWGCWKFNRIEETETIKAFLAYLTRSVKYENDKQQNAIAILAIPHFEKSGTLHYHFLVRSKLGNLEDWLKTRIAKFNKKHNTVISLPYLEVPRDVERVSKYAFKVGDRSKLIPQSNQGFRSVYHAGKYFRPQDELEEAQEKDQEKDQEEAPEQDQEQQELDQDQDQDQERPELVKLPIVARCRSP